VVLLTRGGGVKARDIETCTYRQSSL